MAGSRLEKIGSIFSRMTGLLRSGAVKDVDKPLWYEIYQAFPPAQVPEYQRPKPTQTVPNILYAEDIIRAKFYEVYGNPDVVDLTNEDVKTTCQKFVERYIDLLMKGEDKENLFNKTTDALRVEGIRLRSLEDLKKNTILCCAGACITKRRSEHAKVKPAQDQTPKTTTTATKLSVAEVFGDIVREGDDEEDLNFRNFEDEDEDDGNR